MNKVVKFRAWDKKLKQMVYNIEETYDGLPYTEENKEIDLSYYDHMSCFSSWFSEDYEVMQYTGRKDKYDKEIYENDVCDVLYSNNTYEYSTSKMIYQVGSSRGSYRFFRCNKQYSLELYKGIEVELIGNIYEHKNYKED